MPITQDDIVLLASERLNDDDGAGGFMTGSTLQDGVENNLFPDISTLDRTFGRVQLRKAFAAVLSDDNDVYLGAHLILDDAPDESAVGALIFSAGGQAGERAAALEALAGGSAPSASAATKYWIKDVQVGGSSTLIYAAAGEQIIDTAGAIVSDTTLPEPTNPHFLYVSRTNPGALPAAYGAVFDFIDQSGVTPYSTRRIFVDIPQMDGTLLRRWSFQITAANTEIGSYTPTEDADATVDGGDGDYLVSFGTTPPTEDDTEIAPAYGVTALTAPAAAAATSISVAAISVKVIPYDESGPYPASLPAYCGIDPDAFVSSLGVVATHREGDAIVVHDTQLTAAATAVNGGTVNVGRTNVARLRVIGADGLAITAGYTTDLAAGTVTFTDVSGYLQPVQVEHRIEDTVAIAGVTPGTPNVLALNRPLVRAFPSGAKVSSILILGDLQGRVDEGFEQVTWTGVFSDERIGSAPVANYNQAAFPITTNNIGAITERWALIFTNTTTFRVVGEQVGEILTSSTALPTAPLNPATAEPYFSIPAAGWGVGWAAGNVFRFNTEGANAPVWAVRVVSPSAPSSGPDSLTLGIRGDVDA